MLVQKAYAPNDALVQESVIESSEGAKREIDVVMNVNIGIYRMKIAVEAKDERRPLDVTAIEQMIGKYSHGDLRFDRIVIVSRSGFTKSAQEKARRAQLTLFKLNEVTQARLEHLVPTIAPHKLHFSMRPHLARIDVEPRIPESWTDEEKRKASVYCTKCNRGNWTLAKWVDHNLHSHLSPQVKAQLEEFCTAGIAGSGCARIEMIPRSKGLKIGSKLHLIQKIRAHIHREEADGELKFSTYELVDQDGETRYVQRGLGCVGGKSFSIVLPDGTKSSKIVVDIAPGCD